MKKLIVAFAFILTLVSNQCFADSSLDSVLSITVNYQTWAYLLGIPDMDKDVTTSGENERGQNSMRVDCLSVQYDNHTFETKSAIFSYSFDGMGSLLRTYQDMRAIALFTAVEVGSPMELTDEERASALASSFDIKENLDSALDLYHKELLDGELIPFYVSKKGTYYIAYMPDDDVNRWLIYIS